MMMTIQHDLRFTSHQLLFSPSSSSHGHTAAAARSGRRSSRSIIIYCHSSSSPLEEASVVSSSSRERRLQRNERRKESSSSNWREEVEERLLVKPKKRYASWTEELNLDNLSQLGPQWWVIRVSRSRHQDTADRLARSFVNTYPHLSFKVYNPAVKVKRVLKNGSVSVKPTPVFPGCVFLHCVMNKEIHDFVRECQGIGGFLGSRVGNTKRQINRPKPVAADEMEEIFRQTREEQEVADRKFNEEYPDEGNPNDSIQSGSLKIVKSAVSGTKPRRTQKSSASSKSDSSSKKYDESLMPGSRVRALSGPFMEFTGRLQEVNFKTGKATVGFMLFGKESFAELEVDQIVADSASSS